MVTYVPGTLETDPKKIVMSLQQIGPSLDTVMGSLPGGFLWGLTLSTAGSSATFGIAAGSAGDSTGTSLIKLGSAYTKTTGGWAVGSGNGSLDTGAIANSTWYHVFLVKAANTGVVDVLTSLSATSPTMPSGYTLKRRIGAMKTNGSAQWTGFVQFGKEFLWTSAVNDINTAALGTTPTLFTLSVPPGVQLNALYRGVVSNASAIHLLINSPDETSVAVNTPAGNNTVLVSTAGITVDFVGNTRTNTSGQIRLVAGAASTTVVLATYGWIDPLLG